MVTQNFKRNLPLNVYRERKISLVCFLLPLKRDKMSDTCRLFPPFGDPWPSCLLPSHSQSYGYSGSHVRMWELGYKERWTPKNWCFWTVELEKTLESPLDCKEIQPVHPKGNQSWIFIGKTDSEAETPVVWPPDAKNWLIWKDPNAGKVWRQEEKGTTEEEMVGWHHRLSGHEFE